MQKQSNKNSMVLSTIIAETVEHPYSKNEPQHRSYLNLKLTQNKSYKCKMLKFLEENMSKKSGRLQV